MAITEKDRYYLRQIVDGEVKSSPSAIEQAKFLLAAPAVITDNMSVVAKFTNWGRGSGLELSEFASGSRLSIYEWQKKLGVGLFLVEASFGQEVAYKTVLIGETCARFAIPTRALRSRGWQTAIHSGQDPDVIIS